VVFLCKAEACGRQNTPLQTTLGPATTSATHRARSARTPLCLCLDCPLSSSLLSLLLALACLAAAAAPRTFSVRGAAAQNSRAKRHTWASECGCSVLPPVALLQ
jgi:hypothetical protein